MNVHCLPSVPSTDYTSTRLYDLSTEGAQLHYKATTQFQRVCTEGEGSQLHVMYRKVITLLELWTLERKTIRLS